ncbi:flagellar assembly protein FliW [Alkalibacillus almallahensis]|uniref:flagellar assembly protein FliW n=1 Tax=Alkalibacillus almallahensis TaxID=1379154 RepID=UPI00141FD8E2|nr:flagellar assembly protein FliW [Alkalibacillus almallahensis]NIK12502.1 flagellar assembly factor FliW [Alkalibacillus almallahensis]
MNIESVYFGEIDVKDEQLITFENGIPGFQTETEFALLDLEGNPAFKIMQSTKTTELAFVLTNPFLINPNYEFKLDDTTVEQLAIEKGEDVVVWSIVTVKDPFDQSTMNLKAPVVINQANKQAKQISLVGTDYHTKHPIKGGEHHARANT